MRKLEPSPTVITSQPEVAEVVEKNPRTVRFSEAIWFEPGIEVVIGGVGSIGSHLAYFLSRQVCNLHLFDMDVVDATNLGGQLYPESTEGMQKTTALDNFLGNYGQSKEISTYDKYQEDSIYSKYMFSCFDNMEARRIMFENWKKNTNPNKIFIDGRMSAEMGQAYFVTADKTEEYEKTLFVDAAVPDAPCTYKSTTHCGALLAAYMVSGFNNHIGNSKLKVPYREVPFKAEFNLQLFKFDKE